MALVDNVLKWQKFFFGVDEQCFIASTNKVYFGVVSNIFFCVVSNILAGLMALTSMFLKR